MRLLLAIVLTLAAGAQDHLALMAGIAGGNSLSYRTALLVQADLARAAGPVILESRTVWTGASKTFAGGGYTLKTEFAALLPAGPVAIGPLVSYGRLQSSDFVKNAVQFGAMARWRSRTFSPWIVAKGPEVGTYNRAIALIAGVDVWIPMGGRWSWKTTFSHGSAWFYPQGARVRSFGSAWDLRTGPAWSF